MAESSTDAWLVCYDVVNNRRRTRLAHELEGMGERIQKSVFLLRLDQDELSRVCEDVGGLIDHDTDFVTFRRQCQTCLMRRIEMGKAKPADDDLQFIV